MWKTTDRSINQRRMKALEAENKVSILYISDPESKSLKNNATSVQNSDPNVKRTTSNNSSVGNSSNVTTSSRTPSGGVTTSASAVATKDETTLESTNATLKRRQVTEQLPKHSTPGENLRFIATAKFKKIRAEKMNKKQLRHMSRRPWERRSTPAAAKSS